MSAKRKQTPEELRAEADRIEAANLKAERMADAGRIPTCPNCGGRQFNVSTWTTVSQSILFEEDPDEDTTDEDCEWGDDYESGDHTDINESAVCGSCGTDVQDVLEAHGWTFYDDPKAQTDTPAVSADPDENWTNDAIQFARLLAELRAIGLTEPQYNDLYAAMDLRQDRIDQVLERAERAWQRIKEKT
jgi:hypothetical protein